MNHPTIHNIPWGLLHNRLHHPRWVWQCPYCQHQLRQVLWVSAKLGFGIHSVRHHLHQQDAISSWSSIWWDRVGRSCDSKHRIFQRVRHLLLADSLLARCNLNIISQILHICSRILEFCAIKHFVSLIVNRNSDMMYWGVSCTNTLHIGRKKLQVTPPENRWQKSEG